MGRSSVFTAVRHALEPDSAEIAIHVRLQPRCLLLQSPGVEPNVLRVGVNEPWAYAHPIQNTLKGGPVLFIRGDEAEEAWPIIDAVMKAWSAGDVPLQDHAAGGPRQGTAL